MVTKYRYKMRITPAKLLDLIEATIGRRPDEMGKSGLHYYSVTFNDTDISAQDRDDLKNALPECIKLLFDFNRTVVEVEE